MAGYFYRFGAKLSGVLSKGGYSDDRDAKKLEDTKVAVLVKEWEKSYKCYTPLLEMMAKDHSILPPSSTKPCQIVTLKETLEAGSRRSGWDGGWHVPCNHVFNKFCTFQLVMCHHDDDSQRRYDLYICSKCAKLALKSKFIHDYQYLINAPSKHCEICPEEEEDDTNTP